MENVFSKNETRAKKPSVLASASPQPELLLRPRITLFTSLSDVVNPPATPIMEADKHENDNLIAQTSDHVVIFQVDDLHSAHVCL